MSKRKNNKSDFKEVFWSALAICIVILGFINFKDEDKSKSIIQNENVDNVISNNNLYQKEDNIKENYFDLSTIPEYSSSPYIELNNNIPYFTKEDYTTQSFEKYSEWDAIGRTGVAFANVCKETMPAEGEERDAIGSVKDLSGWVQKRYDDKIKDKYLYNRCHLIGWQLSAENANKNNLMTGTRFLNTEGMLPFENIVAEYIKDNEDNHVLYRVTPIYEGDNLLASGVEMEAWSVEDNGEGICFNVYCYNVQPGIIIDYSTGESYEE